MDDRFLRSLRLSEPEDAVVWLKELPLVKSLLRLGSLEFPGAVTFFVGENGSGKSTLLEALAVQCGFNPEGGGRNFCFSTFESHSDLHRWVSLTRGTRRPRDGYFFRAETFYNVATKIEELDEISAPTPLIKNGYGGKSLHAQSHGESFLSLALNRFRGGGLYLLDEPESALSPARQMTLLAKIHELAGQGSQLIVATHSPILLACPNAAIYELSANGVRPTAYEDTESYVLTKRFLDNPQRMLRYLLED